MTSARQSQRGAALIVVLLLAATISVIAIALVTAMSHSARRTAGAALRNDLLWRAVSAEAIAAEAISRAIQLADNGGPLMTRGHPLFADQLAIPYEDGGGSIIFADATACFNLNVFAADVGELDDSGRSAPARELIALLTAYGLGETQAATFASVVKDFVDEDDAQDVGGGAEDAFYTVLPTPYRTAGGMLGSVGEIRAMRGVTPDLADAISPFLCTPPLVEPVVVNVNGLRPIDAPILSALTYGGLSADVAAQVIEDRPPGGWTSVAQFLAMPSIADFIDENPETALASRVAVKPRYIEALAGATVNEIDMTVRLLFWASSGGNDVVLVKREFGTDE